MTDLSRRRDKKGIRFGGRLMLRCGGARDAIDFKKLDLTELGADWLLEITMRANALEKSVLAAVLIAAATALGGIAGAAVSHAQSLATARPLSPVRERPPLILVQNAFTPFSLPETGEPPVSPINPGSLPGSTAAIGGTATGTNPVTGLPCNGSGSISVSGAGGLPGTAQTPGQIPVGVPPTSSIYGSQNNLGAC